MADVTVAPCCCAGTGLRDPDALGPDPYDKAAVLACRIAWNHPLPDGNKRAAWACLVLFIDLYDGSWNEERPDTDDAIEAMLAVAARDVDEAWLSNWLRNRVTFRT